MAEAYRGNPRVLAACLLAGIIAFEPCLAQESAPNLDGVVEELRETIKDLQAQLQNLQATVNLLARSSNRKGSKETGESTASPPEVAFDVHLKAAGKAYQEGRRDEERKLFAAAIGHYTRAAQLDPGNDSAYLHRGYCFLQLGEPVLAGADITQSLRLQPNNARAYGVRAQIHAALNEPPEAIADVDAAMERGERTAENYRVRASQYRATQQLTKAADDYSAAVALEPTPQNYVERSSVLLSLGRNTEAQADCAKAIQVDPRFAQGYVCRALAIISQGRTAEAVDDLNHAVQLRPDLMDARNLLTGIQRVVQNGTAAAPLPQSAPRVPPSDASAAQQPETPKSTGIAERLASAASEPRIETSETRLHSGLKPPQLVSRVTPDFPLFARKMNVQGPVELSATIGPDGRVKQVNVVYGDFRFRKAAEDAVKQWIYRPAILDGMPVESTAQISLNFVR